MKGGLLRVERNREMGGWKWVSSKAGTPWRERSFLISTEGGDAYGAMELGKADREDREWIMGRFLLSKALWSGKRSRSRQRICNWGVAVKGGEVSDPWTDFRGPFQHQFFNNPRKEE